MKSTLTFYFDAASAEVRDPIQQAASRPALALQEEATVALPPITSISHAEGARLRGAVTTQVIDVCRSDRRTNERAAGSVRIPVDQLHMRAPLELDRERLLLVYCDHEPELRGIAGQVLASVGFTDVRTVAGATDVVTKTAP